MKKALLSLALITTLILAADTLESTHSCARPIKPLKLVDNRAIDRYNSDNRQYKTCIDTFIAQHRANIEKSTDAINNTVNEWNSFVNNTNPKKDSDSKVQAKTGVSQGGSHHVGHSDPTKITTDFSF